MSPRPGDIAIRLRSGADADPLVGVLRGWRTVATERPAWLPADAPDVRHLALTQRRCGAASRHS